MAAIRRSELLRARRQLWAGHLFVFVNRSGDRMKILFWDRSGYALFYKRLEQGIFHLPPPGGGCVEIDVPRLMLILEGLELSGARQHKRYSPARVRAQ